MHKRDDESGPMRASNDVAELIYKGIDSGLSWSEIACQLQKEFEEPKKPLVWKWYGFRSEIPTIRK